MSDTSVPYDRVAFSLIVQGGRGPIATYAANLVNCTIRLDDTDAFMLRLPTSGPGFAGTTYGQAATAVLARIAAGQSVW